MSRPNNLSVLAPYDLNLLVRHKTKQKFIVFSGFSHLILKNDISNNVEIDSP
jgi:hypothetical protein